MRTNDTFLSCSVGQSLVDNFQINLPRLVQQGVARDLAVSPLSPFGPGKPERCQRSKISHFVFGSLRFSQKTYTAWHDMVFSGDIYTIFCLKTLTLFQILNLWKSSEVKDNSKYMYGTIFAYN